MEGVAMPNSQNPIRLITEMGKARKGVTKNDTFKDAVPLINDVFWHAWEERLDVFVICRGLADAKNELFESITGNTFCDLIEKLVKRGSNVCLLLWTKDEAELELPAVTTLKDRVKDGPGRLEIRLSHTDEKFGHLLIAASPERDRWLLRVEKAHGQSTYHPDFDVPAAVFFDNDEARRYAKPALSQFAFFFGESDLIPREFWPEPSDGFGPDSRASRQPEYAG
jgi:hypothetical protein